MTADEMNELLQLRASLTAVSAEKARLKIELGAMVDQSKYDQHVRLGHALEQAGDMQLMANEQEQRAIHAEAQSPG